MLVSTDSFALIMGKINEMRRDGLLEAGVAVDEAEQRISEIATSPPMQRLVMRVKPGATLSEVCEQSAALQLLGWSMVDVTLWPL
jgi:hypothetical protein